MIKYLFYSFFLYTYAFSQQKSEEYYASTININDLQKHLLIIASDSLEGRETGQRGQKRAAEYIARHFSNVGIKPYRDNTYYQEFPLLSQKITASNLDINGQLNYLEDYYCFPYFGSVFISFEELLFLGSRIETQQTIKGSVVVLNIDKMAFDWKSILETAKEKEAKAVIFVGANVGTQIKRYKKNYEKETKSSLIDGPEFNIPFLFVDKELFERATRLSLKKLKRKKRKNSPYSFAANGFFKTEVQTSKLVGENILGYIEGTDLKNELIVITAHYDHIGIHEGKIHNGADDDGSGTVSILEMAEAFSIAKSEGSGPRRSILFMPVSGEEMGLLGSAYYVENPVFKLENTVADLNIDMIGRMDEKHEGNPEYVYLIGSDKLSTELHKISEEANKNFTNLEIDYTFNDPNDPNQFFYRSDHYNFAKYNIPVIFYFNGVHKDYHKPTDTIEKIHFGKIEKITKLIFHTVWQLANQDKRIVVDVESDFKKARR
mgnify:CR=1 FL=1